MGVAWQEAEERYRRLANNGNDNGIHFRRYRHVRGGVKIAKLGDFPPSIRQTLEKVSDELRRTGRESDYKYAKEMIDKGRIIVETTYPGPMRAVAIWKVSRHLPK